MSRAAARKAELSDELPHPRQTGVLFGHTAAERALLDAYKSDRLPHAWLLGGPAGIGKATLAYRMARFVLAHPDPRAEAVQRAETLAVDPSHGVARRVAAQAHPDLLSLERTLNEKGVLRTVIRVDEVRRTVSFFGSTAGEGGWRVCVVDTADELKQPEAANALLKMLEEPPRRSLFLLVSHAPGRLLPTIRSRCCRLDLRPLSAEDVAQAAAAALGGDVDADDLRRAAAAAEGSVARALMLLGGSALALRERVLTLLNALPAVDPKQLHALGDALGPSDKTGLALVVDGVSQWLERRLDDASSQPARLAQVAQVWENVTRAARDVESLNLERKPLVFTIFGQLAAVAQSQSATRSL